MEEKIFLGYQYGSFKTDDGRTQRFSSAFFMEPFPSDVANPDYHTGGYRAAKYRLAVPALVNGLEPLDVVEVYFSSKGTITKIVKVENKTVEDVIAADLEERELYSVRT